MKFSFKKNIKTLTDSADICGVDGYETGGLYGEDGGRAAEVTDLATVP